MLVGHIDFERGGFSVYDVLYTRVCIFECFAYIGDSFEFLCDDVVIKMGEFLYVDLIIDE